jgi:hypothetical protein
MPYRQWDGIKACGMGMSKGYSRKFRSTFYGSYVVNGRKHTVDLGVKIRDNVINSGS